MRYKKRALPRMKPNAAQLRKITRRRHIGWQLKGREYNIHFPFETSGALPGSTDRVQGVTHLFSSERVETAEHFTADSSSFHENCVTPPSLDFVQNNATVPMEDAQLHEIGAPPLERRLRLGAIEGSGTTTTRHLVSSGTLVLPQTKHHAPENHIVRIQAFLRGCRDRHRVSRALNYEQLKRRAMLKRFSTHRREIIAARSKNLVIFKQATNVQRLFRGFLARQKYRKMNRSYYGVFAQRIQMLVRKHLARREIACRRQAVHWGTFSARLGLVLSIQMWYRQHVGRRIVQARRNRRNYMSLRADVCKTLGVLWSEHICNAALWRTIRVVLKRVEDNKEKLVGFIPLQAKFRGIRQRKAYLQMIQDLEDEKLA